MSGMITDATDTERFSHEREMRSREVRDARSGVNQFDYIPLISIVSAAVRGIFGTIELVLGLFTWPIEIAFGRITEPNFLFVDGCLNIFRSSIAWMPILGNVILYLYDSNRSVHPH